MSEIISILLNYTDFNTAKQIEKDLLENGLIKKETEDQDNERV